MSFANCGMSWDRAGLRAYLVALQRPAWCKGVTFHHTATPNLYMRPFGWSAQLVRYMKEGYQAKGWNRGPHFYPDDKEVWGLTPPSEAGIHAVAFNRTHIGIEVLGDYDGRDDAKSGRGLRCWQNAFWTAAEVLDWIGLEPSTQTINFHRDDHNTSKSCPGKTISREWVIAGVKASDGYATMPPHEPSERVVISEWLKSKGMALPIVRNSDGHIIVGKAWIESAKYDAAKEETTALRSELEADLP